MASYHSINISSPQLIISSSHHRTARLDPLTRDPGPPACQYLDVGDYLDDIHCMSPYMPRRHYDTMRRHETLRGDNFVHESMGSDRWLLMRMKGNRLHAYMMYLIIWMLHVIISCPSPSPSPSSCPPLCPHSTLPLLAVDTVLTLTLSSSHLHSPLPSYRANLHPHPHVHPHPRLNSSVEMCSHGVHPLRGVQGDHCDPRVDLCTTTLHHRMQSTGQYSTVQPSPAICPLSRRDMARRICARVLSYHFRC